MWVCFLPFFSLLPVKKICSLMSNVNVECWNQAFTSFSFWKNYFLLHLLWMLTPFLFTTLLGHISVLFCSLCHQMFYTFFCLSVMSPSPSTSKGISPPGTLFRLTTPHISPGLNPAAFTQLNPGFTSRTAWIF